MIGAILLSALLMGLLGSTHCAVMCGSVAGVLSSGVTQIGRKPANSGAVIALANNAGRVVSYATAGAFAGAFGALVDRIPALHGAELGLRFAAGLLMLGLGLHLAGVWRRFAAIERVGLPFWRLVEPLARRLLPARNVGSAFTLGLLWGWMPCGLVYAALGLALTTGSATGGALAMLAFGAGTLPMLFAMGALAARVARFTRVVWVRRAAGLAIVVFGVFHVVAASAQIVGGSEAKHSCCAGKHGG